MLQGVRCKMGMHKWGPVQGDAWGAFHKCHWCLKVKRLGSDHQADAHDKLR
jgi:hypothetical protein